MVVTILLVLLAVCLLAFFAALPVMRFLVCMFGLSLVDLFIDLIDRMFSNHKYSDDEDNL